MADISVTLVLDDKEFTGKLAAAGKAADDFGKKAVEGTNKAGEGFTKITSMAEGLKGKMEGLTTVLLGVGFLEMAHKALDLSDSISDLSHGTDVSIPKILQMREAFEANGGSAEKLGKILSKLSTYLYDAREGSAQAQESLLKLGLSFSQMANLDTEEALKATIDRLAEMTDPIERNALALRIFGKEAKNIDWKGIQDGTKSSTEEYDKYAKGIEAAGKAHDKLIAASEKLLIAFTNLLEKTGVLKFINDMSDNMEKFERIVTIAGVAFGVYFGTKFVIMAVEAAEAISKITKAVIALDLAMNAGLISRLGMAARALTAIGLALYSSDLNKGEDEQLKVIKDREKAISDLPKKYQEAFFKMNQEDQNRVNEMVKNGKGMAEDIAKVAGMPEGKKAAVTPAWAAEVKALDQISDAYERVINTATGKYRVDTALIGSTQEQAEKTRLLNGLTTEYNNKMAELNDQESKLAMSPASAARDAKIGQLRKEKKEVSDLYDVNFDTMVKEIAKREEATKVYKDYLLQFDEEVNKNKMLAEITNQTTQLGMTANQKRHQQVIANMRAEAQAEIDAKNKERGSVELGGLGPMNDAEAQKYFDRAMKRAEELNKATDEQVAKSRQFGTGWKEAFDSYVDSATNAANQAKSVFDAVTGSMNSAIDNFVTTGKFSFGDFAKSVVMDLEKIALKAAMANVIGGIPGLGSLFGGHAMGGSIPAGQFGLVGEQGPELIKGPATVMTNNATKDAMGSATHNTYNINAVDAKSVAQLFAENRMTLFGTVEQARRELPMRTR